MLPRCRGVGSFGVPMGHLRAFGCVALLTALGCANRQHDERPDARALSATSASAAAVTIRAARPDASVPAPGPRLAALGIPLTETHKQARLSWRRWHVVNWQGVADSLPALPPEPVGDPRGCASGMARVRGSFVIDASGRDDTDAVLAEQNATCTFWRTRTRGENGLCDRFDADKWRARVAALPKKAMDFCIDRYEYPNAYGELPLVAVTFSEAEEYCKLEKKRLCSENEWTFACEGEQALPYPYGFERDPEKCNIHVLGPGPTKDMFSPRFTNATARGIDLSWRGKRSGELGACKSPFGVMDLTGNVDEWTSNARKYGRKMIMKGGHWGPARQRCRPATRGHGPNYVRYDQGFRCCTDAPR
jgi:hypothetical protein